MTCSEIAKLPSDFDVFLFASVHEGDGPVLSVLSSLARQNLDPWAEAAKLARLPKAAATKSLASLLATKGGADGTCQTSNSAATRLVALLPSKRKSDIPHPDAIAARNREMARLYTFFTAFIAVTCVALALIAWSSYYNRMVTLSTGAPAGTKAGTAQAAPASSSKAKPKLCSKGQET